MGKNVFVAIAAAAFLTQAAHGQAGTAGTGNIAVSIDAGKTGVPISPYIYGQFIEHIGDLINRSMWAEMLDDRKFYNDITSKPAEAGPGRGGRGFGRGGRQTAFWRPLGPDESVVMDRQNPYVGEHTPLIRLAGSSPRGIQQGGLAVRKAKAYTGRIVLAGEPGAKITVSLVWGAGQSERQTVAIPSLSRAYAKFPLKFTAGADNNDARFEIAGTGRVRSI